MTSLGEHMLQMRSKEAVARGDMRWYSADRDVANIVPKVFRRTFFRCDPDQLTKNEKALLQDLGISNEDLCQIAASIARLFKIMRYGQVNPRRALELLGVLEPEDSDEAFKERDQTMQVIQDITKDNPLFDYTNIQWCMSSGLKPNKAYLFVGMVFFQQMLLTYIDAYRQTVHPGEEDPNNLELRRFYEMLSPPKSNSSWLKKVVSRLYWKFGSRYRL